MNLYSIALFVHITGAVLIFVLLTVEGVGYRVGYSSAALNRVLGPISALMIFVPGIYMAVTQTGWQPWVVLGLASYLLIASLGAFTGIRVMRGEMSVRTATLSWLARVGIAAGVLFDMTVKPDVVVSIAAILVACGLAMAASLVRRRAAAPA